MPEELAVKHESNFLQGKIHFKETYTFCPHFLADTRILALGACPVLLK